MPINPDAAGDSSEPLERSWTSKDAMLYAVGVGAGYPDPLAELEFTTENSRGIVQRALPTMSVVLNAGGARAARNLGSVDYSQVVHGEQKFELHRPLPAEGRAKIVSTISAIHAKGSGAVVVTESRAVVPVTDEPMYTNTSSTFIRGAGGFGGDRGPSGLRNVAPDRVPDYEVTYQIKPDQALVYRLSGDHNPLHADPWAAARSGFDRPILHGLCTYGFTGRALLHTLCGSDPATVRSMEARFSQPVYPGDALTVSMWVEGTRAVFRASAHGVTVLDNGLFTFDI